MYAVDIAHVGTSDELWSWLSAARELDQAVAALEEAGRGLGLLVADSEWQAKGVRALHEQLSTYTDRSAAEVSELRARVWELESVTGS